MLETTLALISVVSVLAIVGVALYALHSIRALQVATFAHFEATRPIGTTIAKLAEQEMAFQRQVHSDRTEDAREMREFVRNSTTADVLS